MPHNYNTDPKPISTIGLKILLTEKLLLTLLALLVGLSSGSMLSGRLNLLLETTLNPNPVVEQLPIGEDCLLTEKTK